MKSPIALATWTFGSTAVEAAWEKLDSGGSPLDAVEAGCVAVENDPTVHSVGIGGLPDRSGEVSLDGSIMLSPDRCAGVANLRRHAHPVSVARQVMERTTHKLLVGAQADDFAEMVGMQPAELLTQYSREKYNQWVEQHPAAALDSTVDWQQDANAEEKDRPTTPRDDRDDASHDTVGVLVASGGSLAGACSTSGLSFKVAGRVGDSPIIGQGLYVDPAIGAAVATGAGELAMGVCASFLAVEMLRQAKSPKEAALATLQRVADQMQLRPHHQLGVIVLGKDGNWSSASLRNGFSVAVHRLRAGAARAGFNSA